MSTDDELDEYEEKTGKLVNDKWNAEIRESKKESRLIDHSLIIHEKLQKYRDNYCCHILDECRSGDVLNFLWDLLDEEYFDPSLKSKEPQDS